MCFGELKMQISRLGAACALVVLAGAAIAPAETNATLDARPTAPAAVTPTPEAPEVAARLLIHKRLKLVLNVHRTAIA